MKNLLRPWLFWKHFVFCFLLFFVIWPPICRQIFGSFDFMGPLTQIFLSRIFGLREASSIGVIGGPDGPTAIFVTPSAGLIFLPYVIEFIIALFLYWTVKRLMERFF